MRFALPNYMRQAISGCLGLLLSLTIALQVSATPINPPAKPTVSAGTSASNTCGLLPPVLSPSALTATVGSGPVSITATGCPGGIIQYFGSAGVGTIAPGKTISVPTSATGVMLISTLCSFSGCTSDVSSVTILVKPSTNPSLTPIVSNTIASQTGTVGNYLIYQIPTNTFTDPKNDQLTLTASGLPDGLFFNGSVIVGPLKAAGTSLITITATNSQGFSNSTSFTLTVTGGPVVTNPFAITGVSTISCVTLAPDAKRVTFTPLYAGMTGEAITVSVVNEMAPTTTPGPYTLKLYIDNPTITIQAIQSGSPGVSSFNYNWLTACNSASANTPPTVAAAIPSQTATVGQSFNYTIPSGTFTDAETPTSLSLSVSGLPAGLTFTAPNVISGAPSTTVGSPFSVTVTATDPGGLSVSTTFALVVKPSAAPFAIIGVTGLSCLTVTATQRRLTFTPQYTGLTGQPVSFSVVNEMLPTTNPGPYTLNLYTDNPTITLKAAQGSTPPLATTTYVYNWLAVCGTSPGPNTPPTVVAAIPSQTATVGQSFSYTIPSGTFTDAETPASLSLSVRGLPAGLTFTAPNVISGTASSTVGSPFSVTVTATDPGSLSVSTTFGLTVAPSTGAFAIVGVNTISCTATGPTQRQITYNPLYSGLNGQPITFAAVNESLPTTNPGPYTLTLYIDNPTITLRASQAGSAGVSNFVYNWASACGSFARKGSEPLEKLMITVLGNPASSETVEVEIRGAVGQVLRLQSTDMKGNVINRTRIEQAGSVERATIKIGSSAGIYLLQAATDAQQQVVKIQKQ